MPVDQRPRIIQIATTPAVTVRNVVVRLNCPVIDVTASPSVRTGATIFGSQSNDMLQVMNQIAAPEIAR